MAHLQRVRFLLLATLLVTGVSCSRKPPGGVATSPGAPVILISIDTLRADRLGAYGYDRETSPSIDALARRGTLFENALSESGWTLPAHVTMLTGRSPASHRVAHPAH